MKIIFIGEKRSPTAIRRGWTWEDGHLSAKQLFDALKYCKVSRDECTFFNVNSRQLPWVLYGIVGPVIALGKKSDAYLTKKKIVHFYMVHPAARGTIRRKANYCRHVKRVLMKAGWKLK